MRPPLRGSESTLLWRSSWIIGLFGFLLAGCGDGSGPGDGDTATIQVLHARTEIDPVRFLINGSAISPTPAVGTFSVARRVEPGSHTVSVEFETSPNFPIAERIIEAQASTDYLALFGFTPDSDADLLVIADTFPPPASDQVKLRLLHLDFYTSFVDVYLAPPGGDYSAVPTWPNLDLGSATDFLLLPPGDYRIRLNGSGTSEIAHEAFTGALEGGTVVTAISLPTQVDQPRQFAFWP